MTQWARLSAIECIHDMRFCLFEPLLIGHIFDELAGLFDDVVVLLADV